MNGLLVKDYLHQAAGTNPVTFAEQYYLHYPKIAPLMWPPLFHAVLGVSLLPGWDPGATASFLIALAVAWTTWRLHHIVTILAGPVAAIAAAALFLTAPVVTEFVTVVMLDLVIAAWALEAAIALVLAVSETAAGCAARSENHGAQRDAGRE